METDWLADAYEKANEGDWSLFASHVAENYTHDVPAIGAHWTSRDEAIENLKARYSEINMRQSVKGVAEFGEFVIVNVEFTSGLRPAPAHAVHVFRAEDDKFVGLVGAYPPVTSD